MKNKKNSFPKITMYNYVQQINYLNINKLQFLKLCTLKRNYVQKLCTAVSLYIVPFCACT